MGKIRVLEFSNQWSIGGVEKTAQLFMENIDKERFEVYAAGWRGGERVDLIKPLVEEIFLNEDAKAMTDWIKEKKIDICHFHRMGSAEPPLIDVLRDAGVKILVEHNIFAHFDSTSDRMHIDRHIFVSKAQVEIHKGRAGMMYEDGKCDFIYNPVDIDSFNDYDWSGRDLSLPIIGKYTRKDESKWHPLNVECLPIIKKAIPNFKFHVIGLPDSYKNRMKELDVLDVVEEFPFTLDENDLKKYLSQITVLAHGSVFGESFGITIAESMASGMPVVTHTGGDSAQAELVTDGLNGFVVEPKDVEGYAQSIIKLLKDPKLKQTMGEAGRKRANEWFKVKDLTKKLEDTFIKLYESKVE